MQFFTTIYTIWQRELIRYVRAKSRIISTLFQPLMFLVIFGLGLQQTLASGDLGIDYVQFMYPGIIAMAVMGTSIFSTISTVWDREFGFLKEILVTPTSRTAIAIGKTFGATTIASIQAFILLALAPLMGVSLSIGIVPSLILLMILLSLSLAGLGLLISSLMKTTENFGLLMQMLIFPLFFLSGAFFPLTDIPGWMEAIAKLNPLTYGVDAFRQIILNGQVNDTVLSQLSLHSIGVDAMFLGGFSIVMVTAAVIAFNKKS